MYSIQTPADPDFKIIRLTAYFGDPEEGTFAGNAVWMIPVTAKR